MKITEELLAKLPEDDVPSDLPAMIDPNVTDESVFDGPNYNEEDDEIANASGDDDSDVNINESDKLTDAFAPCMVPIPVIQKKEAE